jgi:hypothetical protein
MLPIDNKMGIRVPAYSFDDFSTCWRVMRGVGAVVSLGLLLVAVLLVTASCTIERVVLYNTEMPNPKPTGIAPSGKVLSNG